MTDPWDRRNLHNILEKMYCPDIIDTDDYRFDNSGLYYAPETGDVSLPSLKINLDEQRKID